MLIMLVDCKVYKTNLTFQYILSTFTLILIFGINQDKKNLFYTQPLRAYILIQMLALLVCF